MGTCRTSTATISQGWPIGIEVIGALVWSGCFLCMAAGQDICIRIRGTFAILNSEIEFLQGQCPSA